MVNIVQFSFLVGGYFRVPGLFVNIWAFLPGCYDACSLAPFDQGALALRSARPLASVAL